MDKLPSTANFKAEGSKESPNRLKQQPSLANNHKIGVDHDAQE